MVAAPQYGTIQAIGLISGRNYMVDMYHSDVVAARVNWDGGDGASSSSPDDWTPREPVLVQDYSIVTGMTDTTKMQLIIGGVPTGDHLRYALHLTTLAFRPRLNYLVPAGSTIAAIQRA